MNWKFLIGLTLFVCLGLSPAMAQEGARAKKRYLYVVAPGIRNYLEFGGAGILVFDIDRGHQFVKRIRTPASDAKVIENIKGVCASAKTHRLYFTTLSKLYCVDLLTEKTLWEKSYPGGCDRMSITPDGAILYVPSLEKTHWHVVDGKTGEVIKTLEVQPRAHNTVAGADGTKMYLGCIGSNFLQVADTRSHSVVAQVGPFGAGIRPFTVDSKQGKTYVNVNDLLGFEVGDLRTGKFLHRVEVQGFKKGMVKRHGCPSHGVGLTPNEKEVWICDAANSHVHVFDNTVSPPRQVASIKVREQPGWITFSADGKFAYPSTLDVIHTDSKKIALSLMDEEGREVHSEKIVEIHFEDGTVIFCGDQFGVGRK